MGVAKNSGYVLESVEQIGRTVEREGSEGEREGERVRGGGMERGRKRERERERERGGIKSAKPMRDIHVCIYSHV